jgi:hypothetical protein
MYYVPALCHVAALQYEQHTLEEEEIHQPKEYCDKRRGDKYDLSGRNDSFTGGPDNLLQFLVRLLEILDKLLHEKAPCGKRSRSRQAKKDSNPQHPVLETSALPIGAIGLFASRSNYLFDLCLAVQGVLALKRTILVQLKLTLSVSPILLGCIVLLLAFGALESYFLHGTFLLCITHFMLLGEFSPLPILLNRKGIKKEPSNGFEPLTPTLPWWCSTD